MPRVSCRAGIEKSSRDQVLTSPGRTDERADAMNPGTLGFGCRRGHVGASVGLLTRRAKVTSRCIGLLETLRCG